MVDGRMEDLARDKGATPFYALDLSRDGISLLDSRDRSVWRCLDTVPLQVGTLSRNLARLHARTGCAEGEKSPVEVWLPCAEVMVENVDLERWETVEDAVFTVFRATCQTEPDLLAYDFALPREDGLVPVAGIPTAVLQEADDFLRAHGFVPTGFTTADEPEGFGQMPDFVLASKSEHCDAVIPHSAAVEYAFIDPPVVANPAPKPLPPEPARVAPPRPTAISHPEPALPNRPRQPRGAATALAPAGPPGWVVPVAGTAAAALLIGLGIVTVPHLIGPSDTRGLPGSEAQSMTALHPLAAAETAAQVDVTAAEHSDVALGPIDILALGITPLMSSMAEEPAPLAPALLEVAAAPAIALDTGALTTPATLATPRTSERPDAPERTDEANRYSRFEGVVTTSVAGITKPADAPAASSVETAARTPAPRLTRRSSPLARRDLALSMASATHSYASDTDRPAELAPETPAPIAVPVPGGPEPETRAYAALDLQEDFDIGPNVAFAALAIDTKGTEEDPSAKPVAVLIAPSRIPLMANEKLDGPDLSSYITALASPDNPNTAQAQLAVATFQPPLPQSVSFDAPGAMASILTAIGPSAPLGTKSPATDPVLRSAVVATPTPFSEGRISPANVRIIAGAPDVVPPSRPGDFLAQITPPDVVASAPANDQAAIDAAMAAVQASFGTATDTPSVLPAQQDDPAIAAQDGTLEFAALNIGDVASDARTPTVVLPAERLIDVGDPSPMAAPEAADDGSIQLAALTPDQPQRRAAALTALPPPPVVEEQATPGATDLSALEPQPIPPQLRPDTAEAANEDAETPETAAVEAEPNASQSPLGSTAGLTHVTPKGVTVTAASPGVVPPPRPNDTLVTVLEPTMEQMDAAELAIKTQKEGDLAPTDESVVLQTPPRIRPDSIEKAAIEAEEQRLAALGPSDLALTAASRPPSRPQNLKVAVRTTPKPTPPPAASTSQPRTVARSAPQLPTVASVARAATIENVLPRREMALIGVFGTSSRKHALVRMANGRYVKVGTGDTLRGYQVTAISSDAIRLRRGGRDTVLVIPQ
ncbi:hypothetical protein [Algicella marina]|uniref:Type IV pilus biogenesis protein PilP n=1 Tax=Algicella marina TaxID=2683284 RepID=A0A6P1SY43_9RHOB|nr:hypothetical protein [Algicella marina]QHQ34126.1 hypothetical protein GO499_02455 [Algicella marina]